MDSSYYESDLLDEVQDERWWESRTGRQDKILEMLKSGRKTTNDLLSQRGLGHRFSCEIQALRERGYVISKQTCKDEGVGGAYYELVYPLPEEERQRITASIKSLYYKTDHWKRLSQERKAFDGYQCTLCKSPQNLETHHWRYRLFNESLMELQTFCARHHSAIHMVSKIAFPSYANADVIRRIEQEAEV